MEKVIPPGLNYADIKPEAIENQIRIIKYTPIATIQNANPNDVIRFHLQGNGFFDPYSAYVRVEVDFGADVTSNAPLAGGGILDFRGKFLDRSAHSLFSRLVVRSQGTELERIEEYDVMAAMINDMIYSKEQHQLHHYEGFSTRHSPVMKGGTAPNTVGDLEFSQNDLHSFIGQLSQGGPTESQFAMDQGHWCFQTPTGLNNTAIADHVSVASLLGSAMGRSLTSFSPYSYLGVNDGVPVGAHLINRYGAADTTATNQIPSAGNIDFGSAAVADLSPNININGNYYLRNSSKAVFCIPLYSGILGVMMPEKKFIPLSLLPLELELTVNPFAIHGVGNVSNRNFQITKCEIFCHTLFFEQELHRSLEAVVAETGIFIHYNSFYLAPINTFGQNLSDIAGYAQIGVYLKSINSLHWTYLYNNYQSDPRVRKLHFNSHCLRSMQLRNGMDLIPSEPIQAQMGYTFTAQYPQNIHSQFLIETYKAWNKMHDPLTDGVLNSFNYNIDCAPIRQTSLSKAFHAQVQLGRCQYGLTLEGEELGNQKQIVTGKRSVMPFDLNFQGRKKDTALSFMLMFLRADFIIYVRPDLVVTRLGL